MSKLNKVTIAVEDYAGGRGVPAKCPICEESIAKGEKHLYIHHLGVCAYIRIHIDCAQMFLKTISKEIEEAHVLTNGGWE